MMRYRGTKLPLLSVVLALVVSFTPATLGALLAGLATHDECCQVPCETPVHPTMPASCCSIGNPDQRQAVQLTPNSIATTSAKTPITSYGLPSGLAINPARRLISVLEALRLNFRVGSDRSALLCTFLI